MQKQEEARSLGNVLLETQGALSIEVSPAVHLFLIKLLSSSAVNQTFGMHLGFHVFIII